MDLTLVSRAATAMLVVAGTLWLTRRRRPGVAEAPFSDLLGAVLVGMAAGRVAYVVGEGINLISHPVEVLLVRGGITPVPAALGALGYLAWTCRSDFLNRIDYLAPAVLAGLAAWEAGCWWQGSCLGSPSGLWWAVALPGSDLTRHPAGVYAALLLAAGSIWLGLRPPRWRGVAAATGLGWSAGVRLIAPLWSVPGWSMWSWWYLAAVLLALAGGLAAWRAPGKVAGDPAA